jgi:hypothetical protein
VVQAGDVMDDVTRLIPSTAWPRFFSDLTTDRLMTESVVLASIERLTDDSGDQIEVKEAPLLGVIWHQGSRTLDFVFERIDHIARDLSEVWVREDDDGFPVDLELVCSDGAREIIHLKRSELFAAPHAHV